VTLFSATVLPPGQCICPACGKHFEIEQMQADHMMPAARDPDHSGRAPSAAQAGFVGSSIDAPQTWVPPVGV
jgi:hypothetical protein